MSICGSDFFKSTCEFLSAVPESPLTAVVVGSSSQHFPAASVDLVVFEKFVHVWQVSFTRCIGLGHLYDLETGVSLYRQQ